MSEEEDPELSDSLPNKSNCDGKFITSRRNKCIPSEPATCERDESQRKDENREERVKSSVGR